MYIYIYYIIHSAHPTRMGSVRRETGSTGTKLESLPAELCTTPLYSIEIEPCWIIQNVMLHDGEFLLAHLLRCIWIFSFVCLSSSGDVPFDRLYGDGTSFHSDARTIRSTENRPPSTLHGDAYYTVYGTLSTVNTVAPCPIKMKKNCMMNLVTTSGRTWMTTTAMTMMMKRKRKTIYRERPIAWLVSTTTMTMMRPMSRKIVQPLIISIRCPCWLMMMTTTSTTATARMHS